MAIDYGNFMSVGMQVDRQMGRQMDREILYVAQILNSIPLQWEWEEGGVQDTGSTV